MKTKVFIPIEQILTEEALKEVLFMEDLPVETRQFSEQFGLQSDVASYVANQMEVRNRLAGGDSIDLAASSFMTGLVLGMRLFQRWGERSGVVN